MYPPDMTNDPTVDPSLKSWVDSANDPAGDFPIQNLPYCVFHDPEWDQSHLGVRIGDCIFSLTDALEHELLDGLRLDDDRREALMAACDVGAAELLGELSIPQRAALRSRISSLLAHGSASRATIETNCLRAVKGVSFELPVTLHNYTDFYASIHHASTVGSMFRPDNPLLPNYKWVPIGYHGRASTVDVERGSIIRPKGQMKADDAPTPSFGPCTMLDYELEVGCFIGRRNAQGEPIAMSAAADHILGYCLVNDWSARDIQNGSINPSARSSPRTSPRRSVHTSSLPKRSRLSHARPPHAPPEIPSLSNTFVTNATGFRDPSMSNSRSFCRARKWQSAA